MSKLKKIKLLLKNPDIKHFICFSLLHPTSLYRQDVMSGLPDNLSKKDIVDLKSISENLAIQKLAFVNCPNRRISYTIDARMQVHLSGIDDEIDLYSIDWFKRYSDSEDVAALHRFFWLYRIVWEFFGGINPRLNARIKEIIYDWIDRVEGEDKESVHPEIWQTYTVVERITGWLIMLGLTESENDRDRKVIDSIMRQLDYVQKHFEYYGEKFTGNHFFNDGRGLYICGAILNHGQFKDLGRKIMEDMFDKIVPDNVFLREGSSHYQFLVTKWLCDCLWIARESGDSEFVQWIYPRLEGMLSGCRYFLIENNNKWMIPFVGDISPDLRPDWLIGVPWAASYLLWDNVFSEMPKGGGYHSILPEKLQIKDDKVLPEGSNDWGKIKNDYYTVFSHVNNSLYPNNLTGHFHHDSGSIVVFANHKPLLIDCGRTNYDSEGLGVWEKSYRGHNLCVIDGNNPEPDMRTFYTNDFIDRYFGEAPLISNDFECINIFIKGGKRIRGIDSQSRVITLKDSTIIIEDKIEGTGTHNIMLIFHVADTWKVSIQNGKVEIEDGQDRYFIRTNGQFYRLANGNEDNSYYGFYADEYGASKRCSTILIETRVSVPNSILTTIERV